MSCICGDPACPSCGPAQGMVNAPAEERVETGHQLAQEHTEAEIIAYFAEWQREIEKAEAEVLNQKIQYAGCLRDYNTVRRLKAKVV